MKRSIIHIFLTLFFGLFIGSLVGCFSQKDNIYNRNFQNLTSRYNILFNANLLLDEAELNIRQAYQDDYSQLIAVFPEPNERISQAESAKLDDAITKAYKVINDKTVSNFLGDAYFVVAKANHYKSNFFNALGFFDYVHEHYNKRNDLGQFSMAWKARSLIQLELIDESKSTLDTALKYIQVKKKRSAADVYAIKAQLHIYNNQYEEAIVLLNKALKLLRNNKYYRIRWTFLLAQLQQKTGKTKEAYANYTKIVRSNAEFIMAFNANLNRISIEAVQNGAKIDRVARLKKLLKDDNNEEFIDQIYYQIGQVYQEEKDINHAVENYKISLQKSTKNLNQKGLSYLKLADIYFEEPDYIKAKAYYDSTLTALPKENRDYKKIQKKAANIQLLADRLTTIANEIELQQLAQLPEKDRDAKVDSIVQFQQKLKEKAETQALSSSTTQLPTDQKVAVGDQRFYFNNLAALTQGSTYFKKRWGDRALDDNWRVSQRINSLNSVVNNNAITSGNTQSVSGTLSPPVNKELYEAKTKFMARVPLTAEQCQASDQKIASAYFDIATHYRERINDSEEAIQTYENLLAWYPDNKDKLATYYNLYRLYETRNPERSAYYRDLILNRYPESIFAKTILNPKARKQTSESEVALNNLYNEIYCSYTEKIYREVRQQVKTAQNQFGINKLSPQLAYLNALAVGHMQKLPPFEAALKQITIDFAGDSLVVPLVRKQLIFIDAYRKSFANREFALLDNDTSNLDIFDEPRMEAIEQPAKAVLIPFASTPTTQPELARAETVMPMQKPAILGPTASGLSMTMQPEPQRGMLTPTALSSTAKVEGPVEPIMTQPVIPQVLSLTPTQVVSKPLHNDFFSKDESSEYYFIVDVNDGTVNLSSSRFGIGQFNRMRYADQQIKHMLKLPDSKNQLIFVGPFKSQSAVADYYNKISPMMTEIMKVPADKYRIFYISKQNFDKLTGAEVIDWYNEFFKSELQNPK